MKEVGVYLSKIAAPWALVLAPEQAKDIKYKTGNDGSWTQTEHLLRAGHCERFSVSMI